MGINYISFQTVFQIEPTVSPRSSNCTVDSLHGVINVSCPYNFQVTVQIGDIDVVANLQVHTSMNSSLASIPVSDNGRYLVTVLRIGNKGIMSELPFSHVEVVTDSQGTARIPC